MVVAFRSLDDDDVGAPAPLGDQTVGNGLALEPFGGAVWSSCRCVPRVEDRSQGSRPRRLLRAQAGLGVPGQHLFSGHDGRRGWHARHQNVDVGAVDQLRETHGGGQQSVGCGLVVEHDEDDAWRGRCLLALPSRARTPSRRRVQSRPITARTGRLVARWLRPVYAVVAGRYPTAGVVRRPASPGVRVDRCSAHCCVDVSDALTRRARMHRMRHRGAQRVRRQARAADMVAGWLALLGTCRAGWLGC